MSNRTTHTKFTAETAYQILRSFDTLDDARAYVLTVRRGGFLSTDEESTLTIGRQEYVR